MFPNLEAELRRRNITRIKLSKTLELHVGTVSEKMNGKSYFTLPEAIIIKNSLNGNFTLEYLFGESEEKCS